MTENASTATLLQLLVEQYGGLKKQLARRLGSEEMAGDALHETYLHLERMTGKGEVANSKGYLLAIATNIARMGFRRSRKWRSLEELDEALGFADPAPDPLTALESKEEMDALRAAFDDLTPRRQRILLASRVEGIRLRDIADELGLSQRMVEKELKAALEFCGQRTHREVVRRFGPCPGQASSGQERPVAGAAADLIRETCDE